jgi:hypothetical protein
MEIAGTGSIDQAWTWELGYRRQGGGPSFVSIRRVNQAVRLNRLNWKRCIAPQGVVC